MALQFETVVRGEEDCSRHGLTERLCVFAFHVWFPLKKSLHSLNPGVLSGHRCVLFGRGHTHNPARLLSPASVPSCPQLIGTNGFTLTKKLQASSECIHCPKNELQPLQFLFLRFLLASSLIMHLGFSTQAALLLHSSCLWSYRAQPSALPMNATLRAPEANPRGARVFGVKRYCMRKESYHSGPPCNTFLSSMMKTRYTLVTYALCKYFCLLFHHGNEFRALI